MSTKESRELYLLERFLPQLFEGNSYSLSQPAPPLPDALIQVNGRKIGIEMTALILNEQAREREANQDAILTEAQRLFEEQFRLPLQVTVDFVEAVNWRNIDRKSVAALVADAVGTCVLEVKEMPQYLAQFDVRIDTFIHSHIQHISVFYLDTLTQPCWSPITTFWVPEAPVEKIQEIINRKNKNVSGYLSGCDEVWLLLLETGSPSSYFDHYEKLQEATFESDFSRTLIGRISKGELVTLQTKRVL
ncbi:hypothetical protein Q3A66_09855 [Hymenobacter sp. BT770]|uniref:hypothetical protein n=1 Tax=Hymenobacter sp. BT770 TaxID=2886942 RepID=UPI001D11B9CB|nr:hypothetical protein [Hymenobacter sp. BT770]MCC3153156.1 hypothetical protein [Hymenobacter sp. BT770]MDO3415370.1 hypothetical protein [Hymenobacter sp. BT770]